MFNSCFNYLATVTSLHEEILLVGKIQYQLHILLNTHTTDAAVCLWSHPIHANFRNCNIFYGQSFAEHLCAHGRHHSSRFVTPWHHGMPSIDSLPSDGAVLVAYHFIHSMDSATTFEKFRCVIPYYWGNEGHVGTAPRMLPCGQISFCFISYHPLITQTIQVFLSNASVVLQGLTLGIKCYTNFYM